jgi:hypothetical protein
MGPALGFGERGIEGSTSSDGGRGEEGDEELGAARKRQRNDAGGPDSRVEQRGAQCVETALELDVGKGDAPGRGKGNGGGAPSGMRTERQEIVNGRYEVRGRHVLSL